MAKNNPKSYAAVRNLIENYYKVGKEFLDKGTEYGYKRAYHLLSSAKCLYEDALNSNEREELETVYDNILRAITKIKRRHTKVANPCGRLKINPLNPAEEVSFREVYEKCLEDADDEREAVEQALSLFSMGMFDAIEGVKREKMIDDALKRVSSNPTMDYSRMQEIQKAIVDGTDKYFGYAHFHESNMSDYSMMSDTIHDMGAVYNISHEEAAEIVGNLTHGKETANPMGPRGGATIRQSLLFSKSKWTQAKIKKWLKAHKTKYSLKKSTIYAPKTGQYYAVPQFDPQNPPVPIRGIKFAYIPGLEKQGIKMRVGIRKGAPRMNPEDFSVGDRIFYRPTEKEGVIKIVGLTGYDILFDDGTKLGVSFENIEMLRKIGASGRPLIYTHKFSEGPITEIQYSVHKKGTSESNPPSTGLWAGLVVQSVDFKEYFPRNKPIHKKDLPILKKVVKKHIIDTGAWYQADLSRKQIKEISNYIIEYHGTAKTNPERIKIQEVYPDLKEFLRWSAMSREFGEDAARKLWEKNIYITVKTVGAKRNPPFLVINPLSEDIAKKVNAIAVGSYMIDDPKKVDKVFMTRIYDSTGIVDYINERTEKKVMKEAKRRVKKLIQKDSR